jgi:hypothetical protein
MLYFTGTSFIGISLIKEYEFGVNMYKTSDQWYLFAPHDSYKIVNDLPVDLVNFYKIYKQEHSWRQSYSPKPKVLLYHINHNKVIVNHKLLLKKYSNNLLTETCRLAILVPSCLNTALSYNVLHWDSKKIQLPIDILPLSQNKLNKYLDSHPHTQEFMSNLLKKRSIYPYNMDIHEFERIIATNNMSIPNISQIDSCIIKLIIDSNIHEVSTVVNVNLNDFREYY